MINTSQSFNTAALLVIDMTDAGLQDFPESDRSSMSSAIEKFIRETGIRPVFCDTIFGESGLLTHKMKGHAAWVDNAGGFVRKGFSKHENSAFTFKTVSGGIRIPSGLHEFLQTKNIQTILIAGVHKPLCCLDTATAGADLGYKSILLDDLTWSAKHIKAQLPANLGNVQRRTSVDFISHSPAIL